MYLKYNGVLRGVLFPLRETFDLDAGKLIMSDIPSDDPDSPDYRDKYSRWNHKLPSGVRNTKQRCYTTRTIRRQLRGLS